MVALTKGWLAGLLGMIAVGDAALVSAVLERELVGRVSVIDGDTLDLRGTRIRLGGIDAPESAQACLRLTGETWPCGRRAAQALDRQLDSTPVACRITDRDRHGRTVARCTLRGADMGGWMVDEGWAFAHPRYGRAYRAQERVARARSVNIWSGKVEPPWEFRSRRRFEG
jgi:endonuclease YncB( thermonuclease family)